MRHFLFIIILISTVALIIGCSPIKSDPRVSFPDQNVLRPKITFELSDSLTCWIRYWPVGKPYHALQTPPVKRQFFEVTVVNALPETDYIFQLIMVGQDGDTLRSREYGLRTGILQDSVFRVSKEKIDTTAFNGYILLRRYFKLGVDLMINSAGDIVWYHAYDSMVSRPIFFTQRKTYLSIYDTAGIMEMDAYGNKILEIDMKKMGNSGYLHQDIMEEPDGSIVSLGIDSAQIDLRSYGWSEKHYLRTDAILRINREGKILWKWNPLPENYDPKLYKLKDPREVWGHANAVLLDKDGNYLISFRDFSQIWKVNSKNGEVMWRLGKGGNISMPEEAYFIRQHSIRWTPEGDLIMFDNGESSLRGYSRVLVLRIDENRRQAKVVDLVKLPKSMTSYRMCSAQKIAENRFLVNVTRKNSTIAIIDENANVLWKVIGNYASYRAELIEDPFPTENH